MINNMFLLDLIHDVVHYVSTVLLPMCDTSKGVHQYLLV